MLKTLIEHKTSYKRVIEDCKDTEQLLMTYDLLMRFKSKFSWIQDQLAFYENFNELQAAYIAKVVELKVPKEGEEKVKSKEEIMAPT